MSTVPTLFPLETKLETSRTPKLSMPSFHYYIHLICPYLVVNYILVMIPTRKMKTATGAPGIFSKKHTYVKKTDYRHAAEFVLSPPQYMDIESLTYSIGMPKHTLKCYMYGIWSVSGSICSLSVRNLLRTAAIHSWLGIIHHWRGSTLPYWTIKLSTA